MTDCDVVPLTKRLECGHARTDQTPAKVGRLLQCTTCRALKEVVDVVVARDRALSSFERDRLELAGYTASEISHMVRGR